MFQEERRQFPDEYSPLVIRDSVSNRYWGGQASVSAYWTKGDIDAGLCTDVFFYNGPTDRYQGNYNRTEHLDNEGLGGSVLGEGDLGET